LRIRYIVCDYESNGSMPKNLMTKMTEIKQ